MGFSAWLGPDVKNGRANVGEKTPRCVMGKGVIAGDQSGAACVAGVLKFMNGPPLPHTHL